MAERGSGGDGPFRLDELLRTLISKAPGLNRMSPDDRSKQVGDLFKEHGFGTREKLVNALTSLANIFKTSKENKDEDDGTVL